MADTSYDGFGSTVDVTVDTDGASGSPAVSTKCYWRVVTTDIQQSVFSYATFCSASWLEFREGIRSMTFNLLGYVGGGSAYRKPGSLMGLASATLMTIQYFTGCTITFNPKVTSDSNSVQAFGETARAVSGVANGEPAIVWVTA